MTETIAIPGSFRVYEVSYESIWEDGIQYVDLIDVKIKNKEPGDYEYLDNWRHDEEEIYFQLRDR